MGAETAAKYRRTLSDLDGFLSAHRLSLSDISDVMVADWCAGLLMQGLAKTTVVRHLNILNSLLRSAAKEGLLPAGDAPRRLARVLEGEAEVLPPLMNDQVFGRILRRLRSGMRTGDDCEPVMDMLLFSLLNGALSLKDVIILKKQEAGHLDGVSRMIVERNQSGIRDYVFSLRQSYRTPAQIYSDVTERVNLLSGNLAGEEVTDPDSLVRSIWAACALRCGATASEALGCVDGSAPYFLPSMCRPVELSGESRQRWITAVNTLLTSDMPKWYAMHLRKGVGFEELRKDIAGGPRPVPELFYPCETIRKHVGGKIVAADHPLIANTVFFKTHPETVGAMFRLIGDRAWCYRTFNSPDAPYAVIPQKEMARFQAAVGVFSPGMEIHPLGELSPRPGESVIVVMAGYENRQGEIEDVIHKDSRSVIFRVKLTTDQGYEWRMDVDGRQLELISK